MRVVRKSAPKSWNQSPRLTRNQRTRFCLRISHSLRVFRVPCVSLLGTSVGWPLVRRRYVILLVSIVQDPNLSHQGFKSYVEAEDPDILVLTETKVNNEPVDPDLTARFPYRYWSISEKKTYCKWFTLVSSHLLISTFSWDCDLVQAQTAQRRHDPPWPSRSKHLQGPHRLSRV